MVYLELKPSEATSLRDVLTELLEDNDTKPRWAEYFFECDRVKVSVKRESGE